MTEEKEKSKERLKRKGMKYVSVKGLERMSEEKKSENVIELRVYEREKWGKNEGDVRARGA
jgi:hypothetical protein